MDLLMPIEKLEQFDILEFKIGFVKNGINMPDYAYLSMLKSELKSYKTSNGFLNLPVFKKNNQFSDFGQGSTRGNFSRGFLAYYNPVFDRNFTGDMEMVFWVEGAVITGQITYYDNYCNCYKTKPEYGNYKSLLPYKKIEISNRKKVGALKSTNLEKVNLSEPCNINSITSQNNSETENSTANTASTNVVASNKPTASVNNTKEVVKKEESIKSNKVEKYKSMHENGTVKEEGEYVGEVQNGKWVKYWDNGNIKEVINYKMGQKNGLSEQYRQDGTKLFEESYENNMLEGTRKNYFTGNKISEIEIFEAGKKNGPYKKYNFQGYIEETGTYIDGSRHGKWQNFDKIGKVTRIREYDMGKIILDENKSIVR